MVAHMDNSKVWIGGVPVDRLTSGQWCKLMISDWQKKKRERLAPPPKVVTTVNGQVVSLFTENAEYRKAVLSTDHVAADGMSVVFASRMVTESPLPERVATTDWFHAAAKAASRHGIRFYILGATRQMNELAVRRIRILYPYLQLAGARDGYFDRSRMEEVAGQIAVTRPDVLWIGVGNPDQLLLAHQFKQLIPSLTWVRTCGGLFDFLSGLRSRAPQAMQAAGLEWAYRMVLEPRRLGWRYATTNVTAAMAMARDSHGMH